jgi:hypothetical protein
MSLRKAWPAATVLTLAGCGTIPDVAVNYYFPRAKTQFAVTQTVGCGPKGPRPNSRVTRGHFDQGAGSAW